MIYILQLVLSVLLEFMAIFNLYREFTEFGCRIFVIVMMLIFALLGIALAGLTIKEYKEYKKSKE